MTPKQKFSTTDLADYRKKTSNSKRKLAGSESPPLKRSKSDVKTDPDLYYPGTRIKKSTERIDLSLVEGVEPYSVLYEFFIKPKHGFNKDSEFMEIVEAAFYKAGWRIDVGIAEFARAELELGVVRRLRESTWWSQCPPVKMGVTSVDKAIDQLVGDVWLDCNGSQSGVTNSGSTLKNATKKRAGSILSTPATLPKSKKQKHMKTPSKSSNSHVTIVPTSKKPAQPSPHHISDSSRHADTSDSDVLPSTKNSDSGSTSSKSPVSNAERIKLGKPATSRSTPRPSTSTLGIKGISREQERAFTEWGRAKQEKRKKEKEAIGSSETTISPREEASEMVDTKKNTSSLDIGELSPSESLRSAIQRAFRSGSASKAARKLRDKLFSNWS